MKRTTLVILAVAVLSGCASDDWTRGDTVAELTWQAMNVVDAKQTANIHRTPNVHEANWLSQSLVGRQPSSSDAYQLAATYAVSHFAISRMLPPRWRKYWHIGMLVPKAVVIHNNAQLGL